MNYAFLYRKYCGRGEVVVHDRTYAGLEIRNAEKPPMTTFEGWQEEEDRLARMENRRVEERHSEVELRQERARAKALEEIRPFEDKLREIELATKDEAARIGMGALECQMAMRARPDVELAWEEITAAQDLINREAQTYLDDTAFVLSWDQSDVPAEIAARRREAHQRLKSGRTVFAEWNSLRSADKPPRAELEEALRKGGEHLERIREIVKGAHLRHPKPRVEQGHNLPPLKKRH